MKGQATRADIARLAGVSLTTVSYVLNERSDVCIKDATRKRVFKAMKTLGYRQNRLASSLVHGKTHTIGVVVASLTCSYNASVVHGIEEECAKHDYRILLAHSQTDPNIEAMQIRLLLEHQVDGLICVAAEGPKLRWPEEVLASETPCVIVDESMVERGFDSIISDDFAGASMAVDHLISHSHRRIALLSAGEGSGTARNRMRGYLSSLSKAGIQLDDSLIIGDSYHPDTVAGAMDALMSLSEPPTAIFGANDNLAVAALGWLMQHGLRVPDDVALSGYGDLEIGRCLNIFTVYQDPEGMGRRAVERVLDRMANPESEPTEIIMPTNLIVRSTANTTKL